MLDSVGQIGHACVAQSKGHNLMRIWTGVGHHWLHRRKDTAGRPLGGQKHYTQNRWDFLGSSTPHPKVPRCLSTQRVRYPFLWPVGGLCVGWWLWRPIPLPPRAVFATCGRGARFFEFLNEFRTDEPPHIPHLFVVAIHVSIQPNHA